VIVNPLPTATATSYGKGSTVPAKVPGGPIQLPPYGSSYTYTPRGLWFQAPTSFTISSLNVPNEMQFPYQSAWVFDMGTTAPSGSFHTTAPSVLFAATGSTAKPLLPASPISIPTGHYVAVLGYCHDMTYTNTATSYAVSNPPNATTILGYPVSLRRMEVITTSSFPPGGSGVGGYFYASSTTTLPIGRVEIGVPGNTSSALPALNASGDSPYLGGQPQLDMAAGIPSATVGILFGAFQDWPAGVPTPFGRLLIDPSSFLIAFPVATGTASVQVPVPQDKGFANLHLFWQGTVFDLNNKIFGMTNGIDWRLGKR
jgi:hypothetical protein